MSVTCYIGEEEGKVSWYLTKESGRVPLRCDGMDFHDWCCMRSDGKKVEPRAYLVVHGGTVNTVAFAELTAEVMDMVECQVGPEIARFRRVRKEEEVLEVFRLLQSRLFSSIRVCECSEDQVCEVCNRVPRRFVCQGVYRGLFPLGEDHWWKGVTDAVGEVSRKTGIRRPWCCREEV